MRSNPFSVVLIEAPCYELKDDRLEPSLGLLYLATWLNQHGYRAQIVDLSSVPEDSWNELIPTADLYGFSTYTSTYCRAVEIAKLVKKRFPDSMTVAGGPHASALRDEVQQDFDFVIVGEGERALLQLVRALENGEAALKILEMAPVESIDSLPFPDYTLVDIQSYHRVVGGRPSLSILSARGCPYQCVFCNSIIMGSHRHVRFRSAANVVEEIRELKGRWGIRSYRFQDDTFTINLPRLREMSKLLHEERISYRCFGRVNTCSRHVTDLLREGGGCHIALGVESGSDFILKRMKKGQTRKDIRKGIANAKASGLVVRVYLIVGFPGETWETIQETVDLMLECEPDEFSVYPLIPYPGTPLYQDPAAFGIREIKPDFSQYFQVKQQRGTGFVFRTDELDPSLIADMRQYVIEQLEPWMTWAGESKEFK